jgi:hypothetical protein
LICICDNQTLDMSGLEAIASDLEKAFVPI